MHPITFELAVDGSKPGALTPVRFSGEESLTRPYRFDIDVIAAAADLPLDRMIGQTARFTLIREDHRRVIHGVIGAAEEADQEAPGEAYAYKLTLVPRLHLLTLSRHHRSFGTQEAMSVLDVVQAVLSDPEGTALSTDDWSFKRVDRDAYPKRDFWAQYDESDFDFLHRHLEHWGIFYYFEQTETHERIIFCDAASRAPHQTVDGQLPFSPRATINPSGQGVSRAIRRQLRLVPKAVRLRDYNDETPHHPLHATQAVPGGHCGTYSEYAPHVRDDAEASLIARARAEEIAGEQDIFDIGSDSPFLCPGHHITIAEHFRPGFNQSYFLTHIAHSGAQALAQAFTITGDKRPDGYVNSLSAIPSILPYRSPRRLRRPVMAGVMPATVEAMEGHGERAQLDAQGRYRVAIDFDGADNPVFQRSAPMRMAQPYGGPNMGLHLPLREGSPVMIGWVDGDPDRPLILASVPNAQATSPVSQQNQTQNKLSTPSGIAMIMNDGPGQTGKASAGGNGNGVAPAAPAQTPASSVYTSFKVPASSGSLPHYWRVGDIAPADGQETRILGSSTFQAGSDTGRGATLASDTYSGIFGFTPHHYTMTVGGNSNSVVQGNHNLQVNGGSYHAYTGKQHVEAYFSRGGLGVGADTTPLWQKMEVVNSLFAIESFCVPRYEFFNGMKMEYMNGWNVEYGIGQKLEAFLDIFGTFEHRAGAQVSLSGLPIGYTTEWVPGGVLALANPLQAFKKPMGSSYNISMSGYSYKQISGVDKDHRIFGANSVTIGFRPISGKAAMDVLTDTATIATSISALSAIAANAAQPFAYEAASQTASDNEDLDWEDMVTEAIEIAAASGLGMSYLTSLAAILAYHLVEAKGLAVHDVIALADPLSSTLSMGKTGAILQFGNQLATGSIVSLGPEGLGLSMGPGSGIVIDLETVTILSQNVEIITAESVAITSAAEISIEAPSISLSGALHVEGPVAVTGPITATGPVQGNVMLAGI